MGDILEKNLSSELQGILVRSSFITSLLLDSCYSTVVEQVLNDQEVVGSSPTWCWTSSFIFYQHDFLAKLQH